MRERVERYLRVGILAGGLAVSGLVATPSPTTAESQKDIAPITDNNPASLAWGSDFNIDDLRAEELIIITVVSAGLVAAAIVANRNHRGR